VNICYPLAINRFHTLEIFSMLKRALSLAVIACFFLTSVCPIPRASADSVLGLPQPGDMVNLSPAFEPVLIKGLRINPENPLKLDFIVATGNSQLTTNDPQLKSESEKLIKYFFAALTLPDKDVWVNLSPFEKDRIVPQETGDTEMGRDMLAQDYMLKQITASLIYPENGLGKDFWDRVYKESYQRFGTTQIPVNTFNKVWIVADKASVYEAKNTVMVVDAHLKVMLEEDYLSLQKHLVVHNDTGSIGAKIIRAIILPALEKEVNEGKNFANLRQIFHSIILAKWYKESLKTALLNQVYSNKNKIIGVDLKDKTITEQIYQQYLTAYKKGVFNYIKEDINQATRQEMPRKYFSGGISTQAMIVLPATAQNFDNAQRNEHGEFVFAHVDAQFARPAGSAAMLSLKEILQVQWSNVLARTVFELLDSARLRNIGTQGLDFDKQQQFIGNPVLNGTWGYDRVTNLKISGLDQSPYLNIKPPSDVSLKDALEINIVDKTPVVLIDQSTRELATWAEIEDKIKEGSIIHRFRFLKEKDKFVEVWVFIQGNEGGVTARLKPEPISLHTAALETLPVAALVDAAMKTENVTKIHVTFGDRTFDDPDDVQAIVDILNGLIKDMDAIISAEPDDLGERMLREIKGTAPLPGVGITLESALSALKEHPGLMGMIFHQYQSQEADRSAKEPYLWMDESAGELRLSLRVNKKGGAVAKIKEFAQKLRDQRIVKDLKNIEIERLKLQVAVTMEQRPRVTFYEDSKQEFSVGEVLSAIELLKVDTGLQSSKGVRIASGDIKDPRVGQALDALYNQSRVLWFMGNGDDGLVRSNWAYPNDDPLRNYRTYKVKPDSQFIVWIREFQAELQRGAGHHSRDFKIEIKSRIVWDLGLWKMDLSSDDFFQSVNVVLDQLKNGDRQKGYVLLPNGKQDTVFYLLTALVSRFPLLRGINHEPGDWLIPNDRIDYLKAILVEALVGAVRAKANAAMITLASQRARDIQVQLNELIIKQLAKEENRRLVWNGTSMVLIDVRNRNDIELLSPIIKPKWNLSDQLVFGPYLAALSNLKHMIKLPWGVYFDFSKDGFKVELKWGLRYYRSPAKMLAVINSVQVQLMQMNSILKSQKGPDPESVQFLDAVERIRAGYLPILRMVNVRGSENEYARKVMERASAEYPTIIETEKEGIWSVPRNVHDSFRQWLDLFEDRLRAEIGVDLAMSVLDTLYLEQVQRKQPTDIIFFLNDGWRLHVYQSGPTQVTGTLNNVNGNIHVNMFVNYDDPKVWLNDGYPAWQEVIARIKEKYNNLEMLTIPAVGEFVLDNFDNTPGDVVIFRLKRNDQAWELKVKQDGTISLTDPTKVYGWTMKYRIEPISFLWSMVQRSSSWQDVLKLLIEQSPKNRLSVLYNTLNDLAKQRGAEGDKTLLLGLRNAVKDGRPVAGGLHDRESKLLERLGVIINEENWINYSSFIGDHRIADLLLNWISEDGALKTKDLLGFDAAMVSISPVLREKLNELAEKYGLKEKIKTADEGSLREWFLLNKKNWDEEWLKLPVKNPKERWWMFAELTGLVLAMAKDDNFAASYVPDATELDAYQKNWVSLLYHLMELYYPLPADIMTTDELTVEEFDLSNINEQQGAFVYQLSREGKIWELKITKEGEISLTNPTKSKVWQKQYPAYSNSRFWSNLQYRVHWQPIFDFVIASSNSGSTEDNRAMLALGQELSEQQADNIGNSKTGSGSIFNDRTLLIGQEKQVIRLVFGKWITEKGFYLTIAIATNSPVPAPENMQWPMFFIGKSEATAEKIIAELDWAIRQSQSQGKYRSGPVQESNVTAVFQQVVSQFKIDLQRACEDFRRLTIREQDEVELRRLSALGGDLEQLKRRKGLSADVRRIILGRFKARLQTAEVVLQRYRRFKEAGELLDMIQSGNFRKMKTDQIKGLFEGLIKKVSQKREADSAMWQGDIPGRTTNGGIDLESSTFSLQKNGSGMEIKFNPAMIARFKQGDFSGIQPIVTGMTSIADVYLLVGLKKPSSSLIS